jgi:hypothetical protein
VRCGSSGSRLVIRRMRWALVSGVDMCDIFPPRSPA